MTMDLGSPLGMIVCFGVIIFGIIFLGGNLSDFIDIPSIMLTIVPTFAALFIAFPISQLAKTLKHIKIILGLQKHNPVSYITIITSLAETARSQGLIALESQMSEIKDDYIKVAIQMVADATDPEMIENRLYGILDATTERHAQSWAIYDKGAAFAPAFGMVATLVSLVNMLMNLNFADAGGVSSLGANMSAALITTFYGSLMANVFFLPLGNKLRLSHQKEMVCKKLVIEGFLAIQKGLNPKTTKELLIERIDPKTAAKLASD